MTSVEGLVCVSLVLFSAFLSASEVAVFSLSRFQLRSLKENFRPTYRKVKRLQADPGGLLITILVVNEVINVALSTLIASSLTQLSPVLPSFLQGAPFWVIDTALGILVTTPIVLIFCEITPKVIGARINRVVATLTARPLSLIYEMCRPLQFILKGIIGFFSRFGDPIESLEDETILKESDFLLLLEEGRKEGAIQETELGLIKNVFELDNITVQDIFTPLSEVLTLNAQTTVKGALSVMRSQTYSRIPISGAQKKDIIGVLYAKDMLRSKLQPEGLSTSIATLMRKPLFISSNIKIGALFTKFKRQKMHMAIVKNLQGDVIGVVTMSDVLEALFEDLFNEDDYQSLPNRAQSSKPSSKL